MTQLDQKTAITLLDYNPETGELLWKVNRGGKAKAGTKAGWSNGGRTKHLFVKVEGKDYPVASVIWLIMKGNLPKHIIDHEDGDETNNRWKNLREATPSQNKANSRLQKSSRTGFKGVTQVGPSRFLARIRVNGKLLRLGIFDTPLEAHKTYVSAAQQHFGEFARAG